MPPHEIIDMGLQRGPYRDRGLSLAMLRENPSGVDLGPLQPQLPERLQTPDKTIRCDTPEPLADLERLRQAFAHPHDGLLKLIGRRHVRSNNSWMHNYRRLVKGKGRCTLLMNPRDMAPRDIEDGGEVTVSSRAGSLSVRVEASEDMMPGVVSLPHGFGHNREGIRAGIAREHAGVSCNDITDELALDALSGNAAVNGVHVTVVPSGAAG
jgi:anaerobic selenocysteine-containing dehydrogenase